MERILFLAHAAPSGEFSKPTLEALRGAVELAREMGDALVLGVIGSGASALADAAGNCSAETVMTVSGADFDVPRYASDAAAAEAMVKASEATVVLAPTTSRLSRALPGVAQRVGGRIETSVTEAQASNEKLTVRRWYYRQRMAATVSREQRPWFVILAPGAFEPWADTGDGPRVTELPAPVQESGWRTQVEGEEAASAGAKTIRPDAELLFVAGAGWTKKQADGQMHIKDAENLIRNFLETSQASLGSSKSLVDQSSEGQEVISFMTHLNQVGQTGATPRHAKGLSTCCHGEEPHVVGWRFIKDRRAVNLDPNCGWAQGKADVLYVADAFAVMAKVNELLT